MRPMESDGDHFLTYYLTKDDEAAEQFKDSRADPRGIESLQEEEEVRSMSFSPPSPYRLHTLILAWQGDRVPLCARLRSGQGRTRSAQRVPPRP